MVRLAAYGGLSSAAAAYVVLSAFRQRSNFFAAAVYLSKSNASMMVCSEILSYPVARLADIRPPNQLLWNFGIFLTIIFGRGVQTVFFGPLRLVEVEVSTSWFQILPAYRIWSLSDVMVSVIHLADARARVVRDHRKLAGTHYLSRVLRYRLRHSVRQPVVPESLPLARK